MPLWDQTCSWTQCPKKSKSFFSCKHPFWLQIGHNELEWSHCVVTPDRWLLKDLHSKPWTNEIVNQWKLVSPFHWVTRRWGCNCPPAAASIHRKNLQPHCSHFVNKQGASSGQRSPFLRGGLNHFPRPILFTFSNILPDLRSISLPQPSKWASCAGVKLKLPRCCSDLHTLWSACGKNNVPMQGGTKSDKQRQNLLWHCTGSAVPLQSQGGPSTLS